MNRNDIDLDVYALVKNLTYEDVVFYFRASDTEDKDFLYAKGQLDTMGEALAYLMTLNEDLEVMITHAVKTFME